MTIPDEREPMGEPMDQQVESAAEQAGDVVPNERDPQSANEATLTAQLEQARQELLRAQAELENYRKRVRRDMEEERRYAALPLLADLLPVMDNLERAIQHAEQTPGESEALITGVRMIAQQLYGVFEKHHCRRIPAAGEVFDPNYHAAIGQQPSDEVPAGMVAHVAAEGYQLHDRVIRPTQVLVSTGPATSEQQQ